MTAPNEGEHLKLLLVEDSSTHAEAVRQALATVGRYRIDHAESLEAGMVALRSEQFDASLLDLTLPDSDGSATVERFRAAAGDLPIVVLTAHDDDALVGAALAAGAEDFLVKSRLDTDRLDRALRYAILRKEARQALEVSDSRFKDFAASASDWLWEMDASLRFTYVSDTIERRLGIPPTFFLGKTRMEWAEQDEPGEHWRHHLEDLEARRPFQDFEYSKRDGDGRLRHFSVSGVPVFDANGTFTGYRGVGREITARVETDRRILRVAEFQRVINEILQLSLGDAAIDDILSRALDKVMAIPFLSLQSKGCIFTTRGEERVLRMRAQRNLAPAVLDSCETVPFGTCICGRAAEEGGTVFCNGLESDHKTFAGRVQPHGHYCVPIMDEERVWGVLNVYVKSGHDQDPEEGWFLKAVAGTLATILKRKEAEETLARRNDELARAYAEAEAFAYAASHDLQEPLRTMSSFLNLLKRRSWEDLDEDSRTYVDFATDGAERLQQLILDLLEYSRIGTQAHQPVAVDMEETTATAIAHLKASIDESEATVTSGSLPIVSGDPAQLLRLLQNVIGNAIKYRAPERSPVIRIRAIPEQGNWHFTVEDNGIGIPEAHREKVFVIFKRLHGRKTYGGTGVGLAVCKKIVEHHGGRIWVESREGEGSTFHFTLPALGNR